MNTGTLDYVSRGMPVQHIYDTTSGDVDTGTLDHVSRGMPVQHIYESEAPVPSGNPRYYYQMIARRRG